MTEVEEVSDIEFECGLRQGTFSATEIAELTALHEADRFKRLSRILSERKTQRGNAHTQADEENLLRVMAFEWNVDYDMEQELKQTKK